MASRSRENRLFLPIKELPLKLTSSEIYDAKRIRLHIAAEVFFFFFPSSSTISLIFMTFHNAGHHTWVEEILDHFTKKKMIGDKLLKERSRHFFFVGPQFS